MDPSLLQGLSESMSAAVEDFGVQLSAIEPIAYSLRSCSAEAAYDAIRHWATSGYVTRLAEITLLDRLAIPNFYAVRPGAHHPSCIVSSGKGLTREAAVLSALFEAFERWAAEQIPKLMFQSTAEALRSTFPSTPIACPSIVPECCLLTWTIGFDLVSRQACFLPLRSVIFPHSAQNEDEDHLRSDTNGLSAGVTTLEAIVNGLFEIIERDAIARIVPDGTLRITSSGLPESSARLANRFADCEVQLSINLCPSPTGIPVFYCISRDDVLRCSSLFCSGSGAHLMPEIALERAITETAQSRAGFISSVRFDASTQIMQMRDVPYEQRKEELASWFNSEGAVAYPFQQTSKSPTLNHVLTDLIRRVASSYTNPVVACVPLYTDGRIVAVRVYCPQMREAARDEWLA